MLWRILKINTITEKMLFFLTLFLILGLLGIKIYPDKLGIDWTKNKKQIYNNINLLYDENGKKLSKQEGKERFFKAIGKTDEQIFVDKIATGYLHSAWIFPQIVFYSMGKPYIAGLYSLSLLGTYAISHTLKTIVHKERPDGGNFKSFPSGHSSGTMVLAGFLHNMTSFKISIPAYIASISVGLSRIYCNRHDIYDVTAGWVVGWLCGFFANFGLIFAISKGYKVIKYRS